MTTLKRSSSIWGVLIIIFGVILLLNNLGTTQIEIGDLFSTYWPVILIIWGLDYFIDKDQRRSKGSIVTGGIIIVLGIAFLGRNLGYYNFDFSVVWNFFWPVVLIVIGINIFRSSHKTQGSNWAVMSGSQRKNKGWKLKDESYIAIMGGIELDLTVADIPEKETILDLTAIMGGIDIKAPGDLNIICVNTSVFGGVDFFEDGSGGILVNREFEHNGSNDSAKSIKIYSRTIMGGIEIKG